MDGKIPTQKSESKAFARLQAMDQYIRLTDTVYEPEIQKMLTLKKKGTKKLKSPHGDQRGNSAIPLHGEHDIGQRWNQ